VSQDWYYSANNAQMGPISASELRKLALNGTLKPTDLVWKDGMAEWTPAQSIKGLFAPPPATAPKPVAERPTPASGPALPDLPPIPEEMAKPKKTGSLRDRLDGVQDKGRKKPVDADDDDIVEIDDDDVVEEEAPRRSKRRRDEDDEEDRPRSRRRRDEEDEDYEEERPRRKKSGSRPSRGSTEIPSGIKIAGFIWIAVGAFGIINVILTLISADNGPGGSKIPALGCSVFVITAFISAGLSSIRGTATSRALIGNAVGSIFFSLIYFGLTVVGLFVQDRVAGEAQGIILIVTLLAGLLGIGLLSAGVLALVNKSAYDDYLNGGRSRRRDYDDDEPRRKRRR
jgi:hypothetical protein